ncbi:hypothetical protein Bca52824_080741 [Brassica carinata]|uniref:Uncharacterized protein n=1 Tax=Brassica carinata TaxID=52824 RepID=A0A8X7TQC1_BRACI|nr:hypothetical protein Bca52824_080741 [Brassica carinata]
MQQPYFDDAFAMMNFALSLSWSVPLNFQNANQPKRTKVDGTSNDDEPLQPESTSNARAVEDLENVQLVENLTVFGHDAVVHSSRSEVGEFDEDSEDSD